MKNKQKRRNSVKASEGVGRHSQKVGSLQRSFVLLREVQGPILRVETPRTSHAYRLVLEVEGVNYGLLDQVEQERVFEGYQQLIAALPGAQLCVRVQPLDVTAYLQYLHPAYLRSEPLKQEREAQQERLPESAKTLLEAHARFLIEQTDQLLLERRFYLVLAAETPVLARVWRKRRQRGEQETLSFVEAEKQLRLRAEVASGHLANIGLTTRVVEGSELLHLYDSYLFSAQPYSLTERLLKDVAARRYQVEDVLSPEGIRVERDYLVVNEREYLCSLALRQLPREVSPGWLQQLVMSDIQMDMVQYIRTYPQAEALNILRRKQAQYQSAVMFAQQTEKTLDAYVKQAARDIDPLVDHVAAAEERLHEFSLHLLIRASSKEELERRVNRAQEIIYSVGHHRAARLLFEQERGFKAALPGNMIARDTLLLESSSIATCFPFFSNLLYQPSQTAILEGITAEREPIILDRWNLQNANRLILGPSGGGKSYKAKQDVLRLHLLYLLAALRRHVGEEDLSWLQRAEAFGFQQFIVDPDREFQVVAEALGGQAVRLAPGSPHCINPFDLPRPRADQRRDDIKEDVLASQVQRILYLLDMMLAPNSSDAFGATLTPQEKSLLDAAVYETYRQVGITSYENAEGRQAPLLRDLHRVLEKNEVGQDTTGLAYRLQRYVSGSLAGLFSGPTNVNLENPLVVFDVRELGELRGIVFLMIGSMIWNIALGSTIPRHLVIDELSTLYRYPSGARFAEEMFARGRKHFLGLTGITQFPEPLRDSSIIANSATVVLLKQNAASSDAVQAMFKLSAREVQTLRRSQIGQGLVLVQGKRMHTHFLASQQEHTLITTEPRELAALNEGRKRPVVGVASVGVGGA